MVGRWDAEAGVRSQTLASKVGTGRAERCTAVRLLDLHCRRRSGLGEPRHTFYANEWQMPHATRRLPRANSVQLRFLRSKRTGRLAAGEEGRVEAASQARSGHTTGEGAHRANQTCGHARLSGLPRSCSGVRRQRQARAPQGSERTPRAQSFEIRLSPAAAAFGAKAKPRPLGLLADHSAVSSAEQASFTWQLLGLCGAWMAQGVAQSCCGCKSVLAERSASTERAAREAPPCRQGRLKQAWQHTT